ncbi:DUF423 domain-containing protein [Sphingobacterium sp. UT-1RO-CII-1]|uniref:DUF423 domain-containing protein n=1 Tax=Sphingobacterium sp. UT-1RO-CII-1 TaxID=2995225 RepID=UPI00227A5ACD|nr:DUF423 domain-containing protein [Sphingobacterium sp. UT-1RO-CII-1]MCY4781325.1 DUF423 domain-containing protein [Sphingobacterium sp. UT-1RO-CII-1]
MNQTVLITAALFGITAILLGAFGAHAFKKLISEEKLQSFEVGVRYQMYAALSLLIIGYVGDFSMYSMRLSYYGISIGTFLFSTSIYLLSFGDFWKIRLRFLGPITPLGGLILIIGWISLLVSFING